MVCVLVVVLAAIIFGRRWLAATERATNLGRSAVTTRRDQ